MQKALEKFTFKPNQNIFVKFCGYEKIGGGYESPAFEVVAAPNSQKHLNHD
jgi:hypothetical protein